MRYPCSRKSAEWNRFIKLFFPATAVCFLVFSQGKLSWAGLACLSNPCIYGICIDEANDKFSCYCIDGYTGFLCQTNWDECWSNPCKNGGVCVDGIAQFNCTCPPGFQGEFCEQNIDECYSNPCLNNGTCNDGPNGYTCTCPFGYTGNFCETDISVCNDTQEIRCLNNGLCIEGPGYTFKCACPMGWSGEFCEEAIDECASFPCCNGGICIDLHANYTCACPFGFSGRNCEVELEMCGDLSPCQNGALCLVEDRLRVCYCVPDFHGDRCQFQYNECLLSPGCRNGGTCIDGVDGYNCSCPPGWFGSFCECHTVDGNKIVCDPLIPPFITVPSPTVPMPTATNVPNTKKLFPTKIPSKVTTPQYYYPLQTDCIPVWVLLTLRPPQTTASVSFATEKSELPRDWFTEKVFPTQKLDYTKIEKPSTTKLTVTASRSTKTTPTSTQVTETTPTTTSTTTETTPTTTTSTTTETTPTTTTSTTTETTPTTTTSTTTETTPTTTTSTTTETTPTTTTSTTTETTPTTTTSTTTETTPTTTTSTTTETTPTTTTSTTTETTPTTTTSTTTETTPTTTTSTTETTPTTTTSTTTETTPTTTTSTTTETTPTTTTSTTTETTPTTTTSTTTETTPTTTTSTTTETTPTTTTSTTTETTPTTTTSTTTETTPATTTSTTTGVTPTTTISTTTETTSITTSITKTALGEKELTIPYSTTLSLTTPEEETMVTKISINCGIFPCKNGGTCQNTADGLKCLCKSNWEGLFCEHKTDIKLVGFSGKSYVTHKLTSPHNIRIELTARTISLEGILFYSHLAPNVFMTLYLEGGLLKFKFSCGVQTMLLSEMQYYVNNGYKLMTSVHLEFFPPTRNPVRCVATVRVNNTLAMSGEQIANEPNANVEYGWIHIGSVPSRYFHKEEVPMTKGFIGCMEDLRIDKKPRGIFKDSFESEEIIQCKSLACLSNPCKSGSTCIERNYTWTCHCPSGFLGPTCEKSVCSNNPCEFGATCVQFPGSGFICLCPFGKQGLFCENDVATGYPLFASSIAGLSTFAAYKIPTEIYQDMILKFKFLPHDREQISLMVFIGQDGYHGATSDHLAISFIKGYVVLTWNLGSGPRRIFTKQPVANTGQFHTVQIGKVGQEAWLAVDNQPNITGKSPGKLNQLNTRSIIFLGGHYSKNFSLLPHDLPLHTGFSGCLFDVELRTGKMLIKVEKTQPLFSRGVGQCGRTLCNEYSCENGGGCIHQGATFTCLCPEGWFGSTCSLRYNPCDSTRHNCTSGSTCSPLKAGYYCDCPVGKTGKFCEISEELSDVKFTGIRSYLSLAVEGLHKSQSCIDLEIRPLSLYGLVMYSGKPEGNNFWSLSLQDGILEFRISPGGNKRRGEVLLIKSKRPLTVGKWHRIRVGRYGRRLYLWLDGSINPGVLLPGENVVQTGSILYLGGVPDLSDTPVGISGKILTSFHGCMRKFRSQWKTIPLIKANILEGRNIKDCDGSVCGGDVCENGGTCHVGENNEAFCTCLKQYLGKRCEYRLSCTETNCQNGGRCRQEKSLLPQCHCPNGWGGPYCETGLSVKVPQFGGNSYIMIDRIDSANVRRRDIINRIDLNFIHLSFSTTKPNGMLLWSAKENKTEFVGIGVQNKKIKIVWAWFEYNTTTVTSRAEVSDGVWHNLTVSFDSLNATIILDKEIIYISNENYSNYLLGSDEKFYLGGFPENQQIANLTLGHFTSGFEGCLKKIAWREESEVSNFSNFMGENIKSCETFE